MNTKNHFDYNVPGTKKPFLVGYRKFVIAMIWTALAVFTVIMVLCGFSPKRAGVETFAIWVVGISGFFCAAFVGGNVMVDRFSKFWNVQTKMELSQEDSRQVISHDSQEDTAWRLIEAEEDKRAAKT